MEKRGTCANVEEFGLSDSESYVILHRVLLSEVQEWDCCLLDDKEKFLRFATGKLICKGNFPPKRLYRREKNTSCWPALADLGQLCCPVARQLQRG